MKLAKHVKIREEKFGAVIFDTLREKVFVVNKQGADILRLVMNKSLEETVEELMKSYKGNLKEITNDVVKFIDQLENNNLLVKG